MKTVTIILTLFLMIGFSLVGSTDSNHPINIYSGMKSDFVRVISNTDNELLIEFFTPQIEAGTVTANHREFAKLFIPGFANSYQNFGDPMLPVYNALIEIPADATISIKTIQGANTLIDLTAYDLPILLPSSPSIRKDAKDIRLPFNERSYQQDRFLANSQLVKLESVGKMRETHLARLTVSPLIYNPAKQQLNVCQSISIQISFSNVRSEENALRKAQYFSPAFEDNFNTFLLNYRGPENRDTITKFPIKYVIIADPMFKTTLQPFIQWKTKKGFKVIEGYTDNTQVGKTTTSIKAYIKGLYDAGTTSDPAPSYVLFVGDVAQVPAFSMSGHVSDLYYCEYTNDYIPEIYYGRFSATSTAQLTPQINKTLEYEQYTMANPTFLNNVVSIAGADSSFGSSHGNTAVNYGTSNYLNTAHGLTVKSYLYPNSSSQSTQIRTDVSNGVSFASYTAHGSSSGWADPSFTVTNVASLTNAGKYPLMLGNCCLTNKFDDSTCFGEALLRAENKGAIGYIGASNSTYWDEDWYFYCGYGTVSSSATYQNTGMGLLDSFFHDHGEAYTKWFTTQGQMMQAGNLAVTQGNSSVKYYWEIYHLMGDPSLCLHIGVPTALSATHPTSLSVGQTSLTVTTENYTYVALSKNNQLLAAGFTNANTSITLTFPALSTPNETVYLVATREKRKPYQATLLVGGDPCNTPTGLAAGSIGNTSAVLSWNAVSGAASYDLRYKRTADTEWLTVNSTGTSKTISSLYPGSNYEAQVKTNCTNGGTSAYSASATFKTTGTPPPIEAKFSYTITGMSVAFTDESISNGTIQSWAWEFGDGSTASVKNPTHTYAAAGNYTVKLTVSDNIPSSGSISKSFEIIDTPIKPCASEGTDYSYFWFSNIKLSTLDNTSAGDGYKDFSQTVTAPELKKGSSYTLTMTLNTAQYTNWFKAYIDYNRDGDFEDAGEIIYVSAAAAKIQSDCGSITIPSTAVKGLTWMRVQVKNSTSSNLPAPEPCETFAYGETEDYYVKITEDCSTPVANFTYAVNGCTASFTNTSTSADPIISYSWTFGNGSSATVANPSCTYAANGNYAVKLTVTNSCGKSASVTKTVSITNCPGCGYDHLIGSFPSIGIWLRDSQTAAWTQLSKQQADVIRLGDVNANGLDDMAALFKSTGKLWYRYDSGVWEDIPASAATLTAFDLGDMNNDNWEDLVGSWSDKGLWWRNSANGVWTKLSNMTCTHVAAGDFDGDSKADVVGLFPSLNSIWIYYSNNTWKQISKQINLKDLRAGNMDSDTKAELVGSWDIGVWMFDPETNNWVKHHADQAKQIAVGDINAGCMQDIVGYWDAATPLYVKFLETNTWVKLSNYNPDTIDAGKVK